MAILDNLSDQEKLAQEVAKAAISNWYLSYNTTGIMMEINLMNQCMASIIHQLYKPTKI